MIWLSTNDVHRTVLTRMSDEDLSILFPAYRNEDHVVVRGEAIEKGIKSINIGLHSCHIVVRHKYGRQFRLEERKK